MLDTLSVLIYCTLNKIPEASAEELAAQTGINLDVVQTHLDHLLSLGLVEECQGSMDYKVA